MASRGSELTAILLVAIVTLGSLALGTTLDTDQMPMTLTERCMLTTDTAVTTTIAGTTNTQPIGRGDFTLPIVDRKGLTGNDLTLSAFRGKVIVLWFMEPWCPHCQRMATIMTKLYGQYAEKGVVFVAIAGPSRGASPNTVAGFIQKYNSNLTYVYDSTGEVFQKYEVTGVPTFFVLFGSGEISSSYVGETSYDTLARAIDLAGQPLSERVATCYLLTQPVTIDGKWTSESEWTDAQELQLFAADGDGVGYFRVKSDEGWLYVMAESLVDTWAEYNSGKGVGDSYSVFIDTLDNDGKSPSSDDYWFYAEWKDASHTGLVTRRGNGTDWREIDPIAGVEARIGLDMVKSPHEPHPHMAGEFKIPLSVIGIGTFGFFIRFVDSSQNLKMWLYWPGPTLGDQGVDPSSWGKVSISNNPIPELSHTWLIVASSVATVTAMFRLRKKRGRQTQERALPQSERHAKYLPFDRDRVKARMGAKRKQG